MNASYLFDTWKKLHQSLEIKDNDDHIIYRGFYNCSFGGTYICSDKIGNESLYITLDDEAAQKFQSPNVTGISFSIEENQSLSDKKCLKICLTPGCNIQEAFEAFTVTLLMRISLIEKPIDALEEVYDTCHEYMDFFRKGGKTTLTDTEEQGLFGELLVLNELIDLIGDDAINCWMGPDRNRHDFIFKKNNAIEVKTSLKQNRKIFTVSNEAQLNNTDGASLYLRFFILEVNPSGVSLGNLINKIYGKLKEQNAKDSFEQKLLEIKVNLNEMQSKRKFILIESHNYLVDNSFPRLLPNDIRRISSRIYDLKYKINLDGLEEMKGDIYECVGA